MKSKLLSVVSGELTYSFSFQLNPVEPVTSHQPPAISHYPKIRNRSAISSSQQTAQWAEAIQQRISEIEKEEEEKIKIEEFKKRLNERIIEIAKKFEEEKIIEKQKGVDMDPISWPYGQMHGSHLEELLEHAARLQHADMPAPPSSDQTHAGKGKVIGGYPLPILDNLQQPIKFQKGEVEHYDVTATATRDYALPETNPTHGELVELFRVNVQSLIDTEVEKQLNAERQENEGAFTAQSGLTCDANCAAVYRNCQNMFQQPTRLDQLKTAEDIIRKQQGHTKTWEETQAQCSAQHTARQHMKTLVEQERAARLKLGMETNTWHALYENVMQILVTREHDKPSYPKTVEVEPWLRTLNIPVEKKKQFLQVLMENHNIVWTAKNVIEQVDFYKKLLDSSKLVGKGQQKDELEPISKEGMKIYEEQMATVPSKKKSVSPSSTPLCTKEPKQETDLYNQLPINEDTMENLGPDYIEPMLTIMKHLNPCMELKIGANIFTCSQQTQDNLCYAFATVTALMSLDSIRYAASLKENSIGKLLTKFTQGGTEEEKYQTVQRLAEGMVDRNQQTQQHGGQDASVFAEYLLNGLYSGGLISRDVFLQNVHASSTCSSCGGERLSELSVPVSVKDNHEPAVDIEICKMEKNCTDGPYYQADLLNTPDALIEVMGSRRNPTTYKHREEIPYSKNGRGGASYNLKFVTTHLGETPNSGHFVTAISNPADRNDCVLVDDGKVLRITQENFDKFRRSAFFVGYELLEPKTIPKPSNETVMVAMQHSIRKFNARQKLASLKRVSEVMDKCKEVIDKSYYEDEKRTALSDMLTRNLYTNETEPLFKDEQEAVNLAKLLLDEITNYERKPLGIGQKFNKKLGIAENNTEFLRLQELSESQVFGTGDRLLEHASKYQGSKHGDDACEHCKTEDMSLLFECNHCQGVLCKKDMRMHIDKSKCAVNRKINIGFRHTPRKHAVGEWGNGNMTLSVIRQKSTGNKTQYILKEGDRELMSMVIRTQSTTEFIARYPNQKPKQTHDGDLWFGEGYNGDRLVGAIEQVKYKGHHGSQDQKNFPIWSLLAKHYSVKEAEAQTGGVNLTLDAYPANNPNNLRFEEEIEFIQVALDNGKEFRIVVRRPGKKDEELTFIRPFVGNEEIPAADDNKLQRMVIHQVQMYNYINNYQLPYQQFFEEVKNPNVPYKFKNDGENLCWVNTATQTLLSILPNIAKDLSAVMKQDPTFAGVRELPKLLLHIIANPTQSHNLTNLRNLLLPGDNGRTGSALECFEKLVEKLHQQAPESVKELTSEKLVSHTMKPCLTEGCLGTFEPGDRTIPRHHLKFEHNVQKDGLTAQNCIDRELQKQFYRTCTNGHEHLISSDVTFTKVPKILLMTAYGGNLDEKTSMEVKFQGRTYMAEAMIKHQGNHHWTNAKYKGVWWLIDDFQQRWKKAFSKTRNGFKVGNEKLFNKLGVVCYKLQDEDIEEDMDSEAEENMETEENDIDTRVNFHTTTVSGQQILCAKNIHQNCFVNATMSALLGNPHIHNILRDCAGEDATEVEQYLQKLCHTTSIVQDTEKWKQLVRTESLKAHTILQHFRESIQQDSMEFLQGLMQTLCKIEDKLNTQGNLVRKAPMSSKNREALLNTVGHTTVIHTICTKTGCQKNRTENQEDLALPLDISDRSKKTVNSCLKAQLEKYETSYDKDYKCDSCHKPKVGIKQQHGVSEAKPVVVVQLKRFDKFMNKNTRPVIVDDVLNEGVLNGYRLTSVILHEGTSIRRGHYTTIHKDSVSGEWIKTDDDKYQILTDTDARKQLKKYGYILFYSSPAEFPPPLKTHNRKAQAATGDRPTRGRKRRAPFERATSFVREKTSNFLIHKGAPNKTVTIPQMPPQSNSMESEFNTPTYEHIETKIQDSQRRTQDPIIGVNHELAKTLRGRFGHNNFKSKQQMEAVEEIMYGKGDVLVVLPTGAGKSLTYQFPPVHQKKFAIIITPLLSLAENQLAALKRKGIGATLVSAKVFPMIFPLPCHVTNTLNCRKEV